ncbi:MAG TPA: exodeoxyribonuclease I [Thermomonas sp.]|jgi:exodeoxyribonuclease-1|uniref:exodeoxyribonuclease I n=1 Tax=Thermomonas sp. TaxID=1971895 RepID=UPI002CC4CA4C|nr:exodeoxyribonuclease I [Thermomonas sp.]HOV96158.1 exodeoxyribonuclease I [Thermomonas sp.]
MSASFLFYDLETFGADPRRSRIAQFAAIRTDATLQQIEDPISFFVQPANDLLPSPIATLITGITPQAALRDGVNEAAAFARIVDEMGRAETCSAGYNSLRFDDEFVRYGLYRNFHDPYEREWRGGNSRWDLLDALRLMHALRPDGIHWRQRDDGNGTSFKLEHLAEDNGLREGLAHEALSDVRALIGLARLFRQHQPKLWDYALRLRDKRFAASLLDVVAMTPLLHISQRYPAARLCAAPVLPLAQHPSIPSRFIVFDLEAAPDALLQLDADAIAERLYIRQADLPEGETRIPLKEIHTNKCPALVRWEHLRDADFARLHIHPDTILQRAEQVRAHAPAIAEKVRQVFARDRSNTAVDADAALYGGFIGDTDKKICAQVRGTPPHLLANAQYAFRDPRLAALLLRYRARNWPDSLLPAESEQWDAYRRQRLCTDAGWSELTFDQYFAHISELRTAHASDGNVQVLLDHLEDWGRQRARELG